MLIPDFQDLSKELAPTASALAAITALGISLWVANAQRRAQEIQLQQSLYDKRYAIYLAVEKIVAYALRCNRSIDYNGADVLDFLYAIEQGEFLFGSEVAGYMNEIKKEIADLYEKCSRPDRQQNAPLGAEIAQAQIDLERMLNRRQDLFGPYLDLNQAPSSERRDAKMRLNGWQRLWVVIIVIGIAPIVWLAYELWPTAAEVSQFNVFAGMSREDARRLVDYYDVPGANYGGTVTLDFSKAQRLEPQEAASAPAVGRNAGGLPRLPKGAALDTPSRPTAPPTAVAESAKSGLKGQTGQYSPADMSPAQAPPGDLRIVSSEPVPEGAPGNVVDVETHTLRFREGISQPDMGRTVQAFLERSAVNYRQLYIDFSAPPKLASFSSSMPRTRRCRASSPVLQTSQRRAFSHATTIEQRFA